MANRTPRRVVVALAIAASACLLAAVPARADTLGYWELDETAGTIVNDATGNGYTGAIEGSGSWVPGHFGNALRFAGGSADKVKLGPVVDLDTAWTVAGWYKDLRPPTTWRTFFRGKTTDHQLLVEGTTNRLGTYLNDGGGFFPCGFDMDDVGPGWAGWHHVASVGRDYGKTDFYVDGDYVGTSNARSTTELGSFGNNYTGSQLFADYIDDVAVWDEPLYPTQVKALTQGASPLHLATPALVGWWKLDETSGDAVGDSSGQGFGGSVIDTHNWTTGKIGGAIQFTGGTNNKIELDRPVDLREEWTITTWFKELYNVGSWRTLTRGLLGDHQVIVNPTTHELGTFDNIGATSFHGCGFNMSTLSTTEWHHLAAVGADGQTRFYVDGAYVGASDHQSTSDVALIGNYTGTNQRFAKYLDDVTIWNRPLTPNQVNSLNLGNTTPVTLPMSPLVGWWKLDEPSGATVADSSGYGFDAAILGSSARVAGPVDGAVQFTDGLNDAIFLDHPVDLGDEWTITAWFKDLWPNNRWRTLARGKAGDHQILVQTGGYLLGTYDNVTATGWHPSTFDMSTLDDEWHHIAAVGAGGATKFFIDGAYVGMSDFQSLSDVWVLGNHTGRDQKFAGYLDDLALFDVALSPDQILRLAERTGTPANVVPEPATLSLLGIGGVVALLRRRRRKG